LHADKESVHVYSINLSHRVSTRAVLPRWKQNKPPTTRHTSKCSETGLYTQHVLPERTVVKPQLLEVLWKTSVQISPRNLGTSINLLYRGRRWDISFDIEIRLQAGRPGFISRRGKWWDSFSSPRRPDRLWCPTSL